MIRRIGNPRDGRRRGWGRPSEPVRLLGCLAVFLVACSPGDATVDKQSTTGPSVTGDPARPVQTLDSVVRTTVGATTTLPVDGGPAASALDEADVAAFDGQLVTVGADDRDHPCAPPIQLTPTAGGRVLRAGPTAEEVQLVIDEAEPGDVVEIVAGDYKGDLYVTTSGSASAPILLRPEVPGAVTWSTGSLIISGSYVVIAGLVLTSTSPDLVRITGESTGARISDLRFADAGSGADGSSIGLVKIDGDPDWSSDVTATDPPPIPIDRNIVIDGNTFDEPNNTVLWVNHGVTNLRFCHNRIIGPHGVGEGESPAIKFGYGEGTNEDARSVMAFNTITGWEGRPYVVGIKMSGVDLVANRIGGGRVELRSADDVRVVGNVIEDGDLHVGGSNHVIVGNHVRTVHDRDGFGPFVMYASNGEPPYIGEGAWFYQALTQSLIARNVFHNASGSEGFAVVMGHAQFATTAERPHGNLFESNLFVSETNGAIAIDNGHDADTDAMLGGNVWADNRLFWSGGAPTPLPGAGNVAVKASLDLELPIELFVSGDDLVGR